MKKTALDIFRPKRPRLLHQQEQPEPAVAWLDQLDDNTLWHTIHFLWFSDLLLLDHISRRFRSLVAKNLTVHGLANLSFLSPHDTKRTIRILSTRSHWRFKRLRVNPHQAPGSLLVDFLQQQSPHLESLDLAQNRWQSSTPPPPIADLSIVSLAALKCLSLTAYVKSIPQIHGVLEDFVLRGQWPQRTMSPCWDQIRTKRFQLQHSPWIHLPSASELRVVTETVHVNAHHTVPREYVTRIPGVKHIHMHLESREVPGLSPNDPDLKDDREFSWSFTTSVPWHPCSLLDLCTPTEVQKGLVTARFIQLSWLEPDFVRAQQHQPVAIWLQCERKDLVKNHGKTFPPLASVKYVGLDPESWDEEERRFVEVKLRRLFPSAINIQWRSSHREMSIPRFAGERG